MTSSVGALHPVQLEIDYPASLSRWKIFLKWVMILPNFLVLYLFGIMFSVTTFFSWFAILFTGRYPRSFFGIAESYMRWSANVSAYSLLRDEYPPFSGDVGAYEPVKFSLEYPERLNQILIFVKFFALIPNIIVFSFVLLGAAIIQFVAWWIILFTGKMPLGMHTFLTGTLRWQLRIFAYAYLLTDKYPPFGLK